MGDDGVAHRGVRMQWADKLRLRERSGKPVNGTTDGVHGVEVLATVGGD